MASIKMPETPPSVPCEFERAWVGKCNKPTDNGWCDEHEKLKCASCGQKATRSCNQAVSLVCGAPLCNDCAHSPRGTGPSHITKKKAHEFYEEEKAEEEAKVVSRTSPEQRLDEDSKPKNLFELLKGDESAYEIKRGYFLERKTASMGFFPAVFAEDRQRLVITLDRTLIEKVWRLLPPNKSAVSESNFFVLKGGGVAYADIPEKERSVPDRYLTEEEFAELTAEVGAEPFDWGGFVIGGDVSAQEFDHIIKVGMAAIS